MGSFSFPGILGRRLPGKRAPLPVYSVEECPSCNLKLKRNFQAGDYVYREGGECSQCKNKLLITFIYAEPLKQT